MTRNAVSKLARNAARQLNVPSSSTIRSSLLLHSRLSIPSGATRIISFRPCRPFSSTPVASKGLSPDSEDPHPKEAESSTVAAKPADLTNEEYHELADAYMDAMVEKMEQMQEERDEVDVEYSVCSLLRLLP
jgi:frataxin